MTNTNSTTYNLVLDTDSYKASHFLQYPPKCQNVFSYIEARGSADKLPNKTINKLKKYMSEDMLKLVIADTTTHPFSRTVMFGLQYILKKYLSTRITMDMIDYAEQQWRDHGEPFNRAGWEYIVNEKGGKLPLKIRAVKEGTVVPLKNILLSVEATDPKCFWLTSYIEPMLLRIWYPITVATQSWHIKQIIAGFMEKSCDNLDGLPFKLHDFGARGVSSYESSGIGGAAHLVNFMGTDTMHGIQTLKEYYNVEGMPGFSIPAGEHSSFTSWGRHNEVDAFRNMIVQFGKPGALFACVSDSYDIYNAVDEIWGKQLKDELIATGATCVIRPDSGEPKDVVLRVVQGLDKQFGSSVNSKGYKVLHPAVRVIQGDGINLDSVSEIYGNLLDHGYSADNLALGMGGGLLQMVNRDTLQFAMKACAADLDGKWVDVFKDPVTDSGKRSKKGRLGLFQSYSTGEYITLRLDDVQRTIDGHYVRLDQIDTLRDAMETVFLDGEVLVNDSLDAIRARSTEVQYGYAHFG